MSYSVKEMEGESRELYAWRTIAVSVWQSGACIVLAVIAEAIGGHSYGLFLGLLMAVLFAALQLPLLFNQATVIRPAPFDWSGMAFGAISPAPPPGTAAVAYNPVTAPSVVKEFVALARFVVFAVATGTFSVPLVASLLSRSSGVSSAGSAWIAGAALGSCFALRTLLSARHVVAFPPIPRPKLFRAKRALPAVAREAAELALLSAAVSVLFPWAPLRVRLGAVGGARRALQALLATGLVAAAMVLSRTLLAIYHTEAVRFLPWRARAGAPLTPAQENSRLLGALALGQRTEGAPSSSPSGPFLLHLAMEDLCFVAEKGGLRLSAVFADDSGQTWTAAAGASLRPLKALTAALKHALQQPEALGGAPRQQRAIAAAVRGLQAQLQLASWGARAAGALCAASRELDRFGLAQLREPGVDRCVSELLSLLLALRAALAACSAPGGSLQGLGRLGGFSLGPAQSKGGFPWGGPGAGIGLSGGGGSLLQRWGRTVGLALAPSPSEEWAEGWEAAASLTDTVQAALYGIVDAFGSELRSLRLPAPAFGDAKQRDALLGTMLQYQG